MGHVVKTPAGSFRANWRDATGKQKAKTFPTKREASAFLAETEASLTRGGYVDPHAGRMRFGEYAMRWLAARNTQRTTSARDASLMRNHVLAAWSDVPLSRIDHLSTQEWVTRLGKRLAPASVAKCHQLFALVLKAAQRDRIIGFNPAEGVRLPANRKKDTDQRIIAPAVLMEKLLPEIPTRYRALVALAGSTGLRWGECAGLRWDVIDLDAGTVHVVRVAVEVAGTVTVKPFPKSRAGRRYVPLAPTIAAMLGAHRETYGTGPAGEVFTNTASGPLRRTLFRSRVWRPALVRAGLLGTVEATDAGTWRAGWLDTDGLPGSAVFPTERQAVAEVARLAAGGMNFHDLRHSYATHLVTKGVPINDVQSVMGHEKGSTTLDLYTHGSHGRNDRVQDALDDFSLISADEEDQE